MSKNIFVITGITFNNVRIKPIWIYDNKPSSHTSHLKSGTIWKWCRYRLRRKLFQKVKILNTILKSKLLNI